MPAAEQQIKQTKQASPVPTVYARMHLLMVQAVRHLYRFLPSLTATHSTLHRHPQVAACNAMQPLLAAVWLLAQYAGPEDIKPRGQPTLTAGWQLPTTYRPHSLCDLHSDLLHVGLNRFAVLQLHINGN